MKRLTALFLLLCMLLSALPAGAEEDYIGNMEVVNCNEWVSLRESPSTSAKRLVKVSLGAIVSNCRRFSDEWIHVEYDGYSGYILAKYLQPSDGRLTFNAMLVTHLDGAPFYATIDSTEPIDCVPVNTIVRDCRVMDNERICVEWGGRYGFISLMRAEVYNEMLHFPQRIILHRNLFADACEGSAPVLRIDYTADFSLVQYDYSTYDYAEFGLPEGMDADTPAVEFVLHSDEQLNHVHLFNLSLASWDEETGDAVFEATLEHIQYQVDPEHPLSVIAVIWGEIPNLAVGYADAQGGYHFVFVEISGEDGRLLLREF